MQDQQVEHQPLSSSATAAVEAIAGAAFKSLAYRTSKRSVADRHLSWQLAQHILLRSILSVSSLNLLNTWSRSMSCSIGRVRIFHHDLWDGWSRLLLRCVFGISSLLTVHDSFSYLTGLLQGGFIKSFMESVVPLIRDKALLVSSEGVAAMTKHMCDKGNGNSAIAWLLTCRGSGATIDQRLVPS